MKYFGIWHKPIKDWKYYLRLLHIPFTVLIVATFVVFAFYHNITSIVFSKNKIDVFREDLQQVALYFWTVDREFSDFLVTLDGIVEGYMNEENILSEKTDEIEKVREYVYNNRSYLAWLGFDNYNDIMDFLADTWKYKDELFVLLGKDTPQNYLVILQNSNEKRPNGWFFWSFAFIQVYQGRIQHIEIVDSYFPDFIGRGASVTPPVWSQTFLPESRVAFIAANWFGFTNIDGHNIKTLYEDIFGWNYHTEKVNEVIQPDTFAMLENKNIKWVLFIETKLLETIMPSIRQKIWEWQFVNASIDIIRGEARSNKKEFYIDEVNRFFADNALSIAKHIINNFNSVINQQLINIHLSNVSDQFNGLIQKWSLTNIYDPNYIYARDINDSYNKIDGFIDKNIEIIDVYGNLILESSRDKFSIEDLDNGDYMMNIIYTLYIPNTYKDIIKWFEEKYDIELGNRERIILGLMPNVWITPEQWLRYRTRSVLYLPPYITISDDSNIGYRNKLFQAPFANGLYYNMRIGDDETRKIIQIPISVNKE